MRLTFKFATAGEHGLASIPSIHGDGSEFADANGLLDEAKARRELANTQGVQFSSDDNIATLSLTVELLARLKESFFRLAKTDEGVSVAKPKDNGAPRTTCEKRMDKGSVAFVRIDIRLCGGKLKVVVSTANPKNVVGNAELMASLAAQAFMDNIVAIRDDIKTTGNEILIAEGVGCSGMIAKAEHRNMIAVKRAELTDCDHRHNGYCTPCVFDCPFQNSGRCEWK